MTRFAITRTALTLLLLASTAAIAADEPLVGDATKGKSTYTASCMACHGMSGKGDGPAAVALSPKPNDLTSPAFWEGRSDESIRTAIKTGKPGTAMAPFPQLSDQDVANITAYLRSLSKPSAEAKPKPSAQ